MFLSGVISGIIIGAFIFIFTMRRYMIISYYIPEKNFQEVTQRLEKIVPKFEGWGFPIPVWEFYKSQVSKGFKYENIRNMNIYFVCNPASANIMIRNSPFFAGIMPCSWAVYEMVNGRVYISKMNVGLMSKIFPGFIGNIMKEVAKIEDKILSKIKK